MEILKNLSRGTNRAAGGAPRKRASGFTRGCAVRQPKVGGLDGKSGPSPVKNEPKYALNRPIGLKPIEYSFALPILG